LITRFLLGLLLTVAGLCPATVSSDGLGTILDRVRFPSELLIIQGDAHRLLWSDSLSQQEKDGLRLRIESALTGVHWLAAEYSSLTGDAIPNALISRMIRAGSAGEFGKVENLARDLSSRFELNLSVFSSLRATEVDLDNAQEIHQNLCRACHQADVGSAEQLPAYQLAKMAKTMTPKEFLARLINGVRGTADTVLANPLTLGQVRGLMMFYRAAGAFAE
jgi:hypothetical protein